MALQNIGASNSDDAFYRYKMPKMITKIEGRGNGIKTNVVNMVEIAAMVVGTLKQRLFLLTQMITLKCAACGYFSDVDMRDKLTTFILKNPSEAKKSSKDKKAMRRAEKERLKEKKSKHSDEDRSPERSQSDVNECVVSDDDEYNIQWQTDTSLEAAQQRIQEQLSAVTADMVMLSTNEEKKKSVKKSPENEAKVNENGVSVHKKLVDEINEHLRKGSSPTQLKSFLGSRSGTSQEVMNALFTALFNDVGKGFAKEVTKKKNYLVAAVSSAKAEGCQMVFLHSLESFCGKASPEAAKEVALVLKCCMMTTFWRKSSSWNGTRRVWLVTIRVFKFGRTSSPSSSSSKLPSPSQKMSES
ncbi:putative Auxin response factor [Hibiscus syriacus]|uniref:Auxin response factor n=1 Tax=Hibiscus syriacus TaxID=106335 RepID=A0A6A3AB07_HIBSY|nr:putative Auxin response factor [Hibiscus syriacus]